MRWLFITLLPFLLTGCANEQADQKAETPAQEQIWFVNAKWKDTLYINLLKDSMQQTTGYLLGGDTFLMDSKIDSDSTETQVRNWTLKSFIDQFTDTSNSKPTYPRLIKLNEIDLLLCNETFLRDSMDWLMVDSSGFIAPIFFQEINLDGNRKKEVVIEIVHDYLEHQYLIFQNADTAYTLLGTIITSNMNDFPAPIERIDNSGYWAIREYGWGLGYSAQFRILYSINCNSLVKVSERIPDYCFMNLFGFVSDDYHAQSISTSAIDFPDNNTIGVTFSYSLEMFDDTTMHTIINEAHYRTIYTFNKSTGLYDTKDKYITSGDCELTPVFLDQIDKLRKSGTPIQRKMLKNFKKSNWPEIED
jgi:hypothetical protein